MKLFIIGATGYVGSNLTRHMIGAGHTVVGFARDATAEARLTAMGATPMRGEITDAAALAAAVRAADATIFTQQLPSQDVEYAVVSGLLQALAGTGKVFIFTSGTGVLGQRTDGEWSEDSFAEEDDFIVSPYIARRRETELLTCAAAATGVRAMVVRPPMIWGEGFHGMVHNMARAIDATGAACYIGRGLNLYSHVHVRDLADLFHRAIERGAAGALYHAVGGELPNRVIAELVARQRGAPTRSITPSEGVEIWGKFAMRIVMSVCSRTRCPRAHRDLGWRAERLDLIDDLLAGRLSGPRVSS